MIIANRKLFQGESAESTPNKRIYIAVYQIESDDPEESPGVVANYSGLPVFGSSYPGDAAAVCVSRAPERSGDSRMFWMVNVRWETPDKQDDKDDNQDDTQRPDDDGNPSDDPFSWRDKWELSGSLRTKPATNCIIRTSNISKIRKINSEGPAVNAAGTVFDPPPEIDDTMYVLTITKIKKEFPTDDFLNFKDAVNKDEVTITKPGFVRTFDRYTLKLAAITGSQQYHRNKKGQEILYVPVVYPLQINWDGWRENLANLGLDRRLVDGDRDDLGRQIGYSPGSGFTLPDGTTFNGPFHTRIRDPDGHATQKPVLLDFNGQPLQPGKPPLYLLYSKYINEREFGPLNL